MASAAARHFHVFETAAGVCAVGWSGAGIACFCLPSGTAEAAARALRRRAPDAAAAPPLPEIADAVAGATRYFAGERTDFTAFRLDLSGESEFFARIYAALRTLAWGETTTYGGLARQLGTGPEAAREVGRAMAANPVPLFIPCHRVLAAGGRIGGFSAPGGSRSKLWMLALEGVRIEASPPAAAQGSFRF